MKRLVIILLCSLSVGTICGQTDSATMARLGLLNDTKWELIGKCRQHIAEAFISHDKQKIAELCEYAQTLEDEKYLPLMPHEKWMIDLYLLDLDKFIKETTAFDSTSESELLNKEVYDDNLDEIIFQNLPSSSDLYSLFEGYNTLEQADRDYIELYLLNLKKRNWPDQKRINSKCDDFFSKYPDSRYDYFLRHYVRYVFGLDYDSFHLDFAMGGGAAIFGGEIADWFSNGGLFSFDISIEFKKNMIEVSSRLSAANPKQDIHFKNGVWKAGTSGNLYQFQTNYGRFIPLKPKCAVVPIVGLGVGMFYPAVNSDTHTNEDIKDNRLFNKWLPTPILGVQLYSSSNLWPSYSSSFNSLNLALRYTFQPVRVNIEGRKINGTIHSLSAAISIGTHRMAKRVY